MKRRDFMVYAALGLIAGAKLIPSAQAVTWAAVGKFGYKETSPIAGKTCSTCSWFEGGLCKFVGIKNANGGGDVRVKPGAYCPMWKKKA